MSQLKSFGDEPMKRRTVGLTLLALLVSGGLLFSQLPALLRAIPSRYVARLPEPVQALGVREHVAALPTVQGSSDVAALLGSSGDQMTDSPTPVSPPPTVTPVAPTTESLAAAAVPPATATATAVPTATPKPLPAQVRLTPFYHQFQDWNNCGPATLAMGLSHFGIGLSQYEVADYVKPNKEDRNVTPAEMAAYVNEETNLAALSRVNGSLDDLRALLAAEMPVIVEVGLDPPGEYAWMEWYGHYLLVVAYDDALGQVWVYDSWMGTSEVPGENADPLGRVVSYETLDRYWRQFNRSYIALFRPEQAQALAALLGDDMSDDQMWRETLARNQAEVAAEPDNAFLWFNLGSAYNATGDYERAAAAFDHARNIGLPWRMLWYQFGPYEAYFQVERYDDVLLLAEVTLQDRPYFEEAFYYRGMALAAQGNIDEARQAYQRAASFNPRFTPAKQALAQLDATD